MVKEREITLSCWCSAGDSLEASDVHQQGRCRLHRRSAEESFPEPLKESQAATTLDERDTTTLNLQRDF